MSARAIVEALDLKELARHAWDAWGAAVDRTEVVEGQEYPPGHIAAVIQERDEAIVIAVRDRILAAIEDAEGARP